ncbi:MAG: NADH-quinone oxidoreductase subunit NuoK [Candidatus Marinimicrobia bacterium]|nr:NADH-quinone oxidoreductase subunit NuoK [Candidatus Neomarinimicrobiota bacterium]
MVDLNSYLIISAILFSLGLFGVITRRNGVAVLMSIELILNAANINFIAFSRYSGMDFSGHIFSLFVIILAAAEAAVALAIILNIFNNFGSINIDDANKMSQ